MRSELLAEPSCCFFGFPHINHAKAVRAASSFPFLPARAARASGHHHGLLDRRLGAFLEIAAKRARRDSWMPARILARDQQRQLGASPRLIRPISFAVTSATTRLGT